MHDVSAFSVDKTAVRRAFHRAADSYDRAAVLQRQVGDRMMERLELITLQPQTVLDGGCATGYCTRKLARHYPKARLVGLDLAEGMVAKAKQQRGWLSRQRFVVGDLERLPLRDGVVDLAFSSLALQWCGDLERAFAEHLRILRPGGLLVFSTLGPDTLKELRAAFRAVDPEGRHTSDFFDMHDVGDALMRVGFANPVMEMEMFTLTYQSVREVLADIKALGAQNAASGRPRGLMGKARWRSFVEQYERYRCEAVLPATYEVVYGHAWVPEVKPGQRREDGAVTVPLSSIGRPRAQRG